MGRPNDQIENMWIDNCWEEVLDYIKELESLLDSIYKWDHMDTAADGKYWRNEIEKVLNG